MNTLFDDAEVEAPLPERLRPRTLAEFVGQGHLVGAGSLIQAISQADAPFPSLILWGPPGSGKTTLARILANRPGVKAVALSAVLAGVKELREAIADARTRRKSGQRTVLFVDEIHRFNKSQQDALLPAVEEGVVTLIGATTENPSFEVNAALLSRARVLTLKPLTTGDVEQILTRALTDRERGLGQLTATLSAEALARLARASGGDARVALAALEAAVQATPPDAAGARQVTLETVAEAIGRARYAYDKGGEEHYNLASALIKSVRNSDANAGLYWLARLLEGGADPVFVARRLVILASEDIGLADPQAMVQANAAAQIVQLIGMPEALYPLTQLTISLAHAPKSNAVKRAYFAAAADAERTAAEPVPHHLRNAITRLMKSEGYGRGYQSAHDNPAASQTMRCLPDTLAGRVYLPPTEGQPSTDTHSNE